ncbi:MAG: zinc ABC transporter substrate-binding protein [Neisseriaceae bacterium]|nr:zinc ABC transporter substrate-binding protein [Neisseriaceae bacterium]
MKFLRKLLFLLLCVSTFAVAEPLQVTASFSILADVAREIGGERVNVNEIVRSNQDMHVYRITPQDLRLVRSSKLVLLNGQGFEPAEFVRSIQAAKVPFVEATQNIHLMDNHDEHEHEHEHEHNDKHEHSHGDKDPHVWQDPVLMQKYAENIANALISVDSASSDYYKKRLANYQKQLKELDDWATKEISVIPVAKRKVLTAHDAFGYLGERYQIRFIAPQGVSEDSEPSAKQIANIIRQVKQENIRAVFMENISNPRLMRQLSRETGVDISGKLYSDALPESGSYIKMMQHNISELVKAMKQ